MLSPENLSLIVLFLLGLICIAGAILPVDIEVGEEEDEEEVVYTGTAEVHRFASRNANHAKTGAAITSEM